MRTLETPSPQIELADLLERYRSGQASRESVLAAVRSSYPAYLERVRLALELLPPRR
jgi:hypothetical protein